MSKVSKQRRVYKFRMEPTADEVETSVSSGCVSACVEPCSGLLSDVLQAEPQRHLSVSVVR